MLEFSMDSLISPCKYLDQCQLVCVCVCVVILSVLQPLLKGHWNDNSPTPMSPQEHNSPSYWL